ncbi:hypothetical protein V2J09_014887 [Rumex salicifolius]
MSGDRLLSSTWYSEIGLPNPNDDPGFCFSSRNLRRKAWFSWIRLIEFGGNLVEMGKLDPRTILFAAKLSIALMIVSVLVMIKQPFNEIGFYSFWALLTVIVMFEYSVGEILHKGFHRLVAIFLGGGLGLSMAALCSLIGGWEKVSTAILITIAGFYAAYIKLYPSVKPYSSGFQVFLLVFCSIILSGYSSAGSIHVALTVFLVMALSAAICLVVNACIFPSWAGDSLRESLVKNLIKLADSLEGCVEGYLNHDGYERIPFEILTYQAFDDPLYSSYRSILESTSHENSLVRNACWEPSFLRYKMLKYPWKSYGRLSGAIRHCALMIMALHGCVMSDIQASSTIKHKYSEELKRVSDEASKVLHELAEKIKTREKLDSIEILHEAMTAAEILHIKANQGSDLLVVRTKQSRDMFTMGEDRSDLTSLGSFSFLMVEFIMRLGFLVDSFHELSEEANYREPNDDLSSDIESNATLAESRRFWCF